MGKQGRRRRNRHNKQQQQNNNNDSATTTSSLIKKLRHGNAQVRHGALSALATTLFHPIQLGHSKDYKISSQVLQVVLERVMDSDLECSQAAAGCCANYVSYYGNSSSSNNDVTAGWTVVLMSRLEQCLAALSTSAKDNTASNKRSKQRLHHWWAVTVQCLHALCALVEINPLALERIMAKPTEFVTMLVKFLVLGQEELSGRQSKAVQQQQEDDDSDEMMLEWTQDVTVYAVRTLHSALDDNMDLLEAWMMHNDGSTFRHGIDILVSSCHHSSSNNKLTPPAQLHAAGCLVSIRQMVLCSHENDSARSELISILQNQIQASVVPLLKNHLTYDKETAQGLIANIVQTREAYKKEQADDALEQQVIETVNRRKEPARLIARRQKQAKEEISQKMAIAGEGEGKQQDANNMDNGGEMKIDKDDEPMQQDEAKSNKDCRESMDKARQAWHSALLPLHLSLEISANLTGSLVQEDSIDNASVDMEDAMEEDDWGPTQEAQLLAAQQGAADQQQEQLEMHPLDQAVADILVQEGLADGLVVLLKNLCSPHQPNENNIVPLYVMQEVADLISKCGGCIGNCIANLPSWRSSDPIAVWNELVQCLQALLSVSSVASIDGVLEGISSAMVVAQRTRPVLRSQIEQDHLDFLVSLLQNANYPFLQRDAASMLGILCGSETHSTQVNTKVCSALLTSLASSSTMVQSEAFNALMDIYGEDDVHADVFVSLDVLGNFQRTLPPFKKGISGGGGTPQDKEQWKETALNASRFIQYKKGQL